MDWKWTSPIVYFMVSFACLFLIVAQFQGIIKESNIQSSKVESLSSTELESKLEKILSTIGYKIGKASIQDANFSFVATDDNNVNVTISQPQKNPELIYLIMRVDLDNLKPAIDKLTEKKRASMLRDVAMIIDRQGITRGSINSKVIPVMDIILKTDLQNLSLFVQKTRSMFFLYYSIMGVISQYTQ
jgi:hypothetical protein